MTNPILQPLLQREPSEHDVLSLYLDMSVNSENKRTHEIFLQQKRAEHAELDSDRATHHREPLGEALERAHDWLEQNYVEANRGVALFVEIGGDWIEGTQLPLAVQNRLEIADRPVIAPLVEILSKHPRYGIALVDREHCRIAMAYLGVLEQHKEIRPEAYPTGHDVKRGGFAAKDYQKYKAEEARQFFRMFAAELEETDRRTEPDHWILLGTEENVKHFRDFLPKSIEQRVILSQPSAVDASDAEILERLQPFFDDQALVAEASMVDVLRDRLRTGHMAISGVNATLEQLQEGKVDTLVIARDFSKNGAQCTRCGFYLDRRGGGCPYCGGELRSGVDLMESMVRMATSQDIDLEFVDPNPIAEMDGVGALLKF